MKSQIYISSVNWCLLTAVIFVTLVFRRSENLAAAYGLAVTGTSSLAAIPFATIVVWTMGQRALYRALKPLDLDTFLVSYSQIYAKGKNIPGTGLFFTRETPVVPPYVMHSIIRSNIIYERNIFISMVRTDVPFGLKCALTSALGPGLDAFVIKAGYLEVVDIEKLLKANGIEKRSSSKAWRTSGRPIRFGSFSPP